MSAAVYIPVPVLALVSAASSSAAGYFYFQNQSLGERIGTLEDTVKTQAVPKKKLGWPINRRPQYFLPHQ